ncbi:unnamed protein product [Vitrella brassicaformis CCMP3155]|uniref:Photosystem II reaction center X protein n=1 Tax=Vitrella brassicaformis (strain CCMP3155) TaxID=1169540 RepID=A0A0G4EJ94_VITBC|nr:unnamed protein product [Vitrella brassicaformis CCMP3155]|mmetsp:Transcript_45777/g.113742  ORF Transcript_45777/g.113742 Transcript_45777/m.113742 type:complete len:118 (-) Transcript_45777:424-777(-)|eukprot:CEL95985.1 unnamed protein product [Vitrella brassicaformis CCMP3155]
MKFVTALLVALVALVAVSHAFVPSTPSGNSLLLSRGRPSRAMQRQQTPSMVLDGAGLADVDFGKALEIAAANSNMLAEYNSLNGFLNAAAFGSLFVIVPAAAVLLWISNKDRLERQL